MCEYRPGMANSGVGAEHARRWEPMGSRALPHVRRLAEAAIRVVWMVEHLALAGPPVDSR